MQFSIQQHAFESQLLSSSLPIPGYLVISLENRKPHCLLNALRCSDSLKDRGGDSYYQCQNGSVYSLFLLPTSPRHPEWLGCEFLSHHGEAGVETTEVKTILESNAWRLLSLSLINSKSFSQLLQQAMVFASLLEERQKEGTKELREKLCVSYTWT